MLSVISITLSIDRQTLLFCSLKIVSNNLAYPWYVLKVFSSTFHTVSSFWEVGTSNEIHICVVSKFPNLSMISCVSTCPLLTIVVPVFSSITDCIKTIPGTHSSICKIILFSVISAITILS